jgi:hypothetical protein
MFTGTKSLKHSTMMALNQHEAHLQQAQGGRASVAVPRTKYKITFDLSKSTVVTALTGAVNNILRVAAFQEGLMSLDAFTSCRDRS